MFIEQISGQNVKIKFDINEKQLLLGDILKVTASGKSGVLVQVIGISTAEKNPNFNIAESKILFTIDSSGKLINWQGNIPSQDFMIAKLSAKEVLLCSNTLEPQNPVPIGTLSLYPDQEINLEASFFEKPTVIYCDKQTQKDNILSLLACELSKNYEKTVLFDFNNDYSDLKVSSILEAGKDIKLPFDLKGLELLYNKTLTGVSPETRAAIEDIFMEIENYLASGEVEFIPFSSFIEAVEAVYKTNKISELVLLRNKLLKLQKLGIFADKKLETINFNENLYGNNLVIVDLSKFPAEWQKELIEFLIDSNINKHKEKFFLLVDFDKIEADKAFIEKLCGKANKTGIYPIIISGHESESAVNFLSYAENIISFAPENITKIEVLKDYLIKLRNNEAVITGKITNNVPLYVDIYNIQALEEDNSSDQVGVSAQEMPEIYLFSEQEEVAEQRQIENYEFSEEEETENEDNFNYSNQFAHDEAGIELIDNISNLQEEVYVPEQEDLSEQDYDFSGLEENNALYEEDFNLEQEEVYTPQPAQTGSSFYDEYDATAVQEEEYTYTPQSTPLTTEKYASGFSEEDLSNFVDDSIEYGSNSYLVDDQQADEDFDYNSTEAFQDESILDYASPAPEIDYSSFYDIDSEEQNTSNFSSEYEQNYSTEPENTYQDFNQEYDEEDYDESLDESSVETKPNNQFMPDIPIYSTPKNPDDTALDVDFQEGDKVQHEKYGLGTVTKIIGSNEKKLCSIQFEEVGRRLLDPKLAGLEKV